VQIFFQIYTCRYKAGMLIWVVYKKRLKKQLLWWFSWLPANYKSVLKIPQGILFFFA